MPTKDTCHLKAPTFPQKWPGVIIVQPVALYNHTFHTHLCHIGYTEATTVTQSVKQHKNKSVRQTFAGNTVSEKISGNTGRVPDPQSFQEMQAEYQTNLIIQYKQNMIRQTFSGNKSGAKQTWSGNTSRVPDKPGHAVQVECQTSLVR